MKYCLLQNCRGWTVRLCITTFFFIAISGASFAQDKVLSLESTITGSQEQPKVIYIVPWQAPQAASGLDGGNITRIIKKELMGSIDREEFQREIDYYRTLNLQAAQD